MDGHGKEIRVGKKFYWPLVGQSQSEKQSDEDERLYIFKEKAR